MITHLPGLDWYLSAPYDDVPEDAEVTLDHAQAAFEELVATDDFALVCYLDDHTDEFADLVRLYAASGLPKNDEWRGAALREKYESLFTSLLVGFRDDLGDKLETKAQEIANQPQERD